MEAKLRKGMSRNAKLSHWVGDFSKVSNVVRHATFVAFCFVSLSLALTHIMP